MPSIGCKRKRLRHAGALGGRAKAGKRAKNLRVILSDFDGDCEVEQNILDLIGDEDEEITYEEGKEDEEQEQESIANFQNINHLKVENDWNELIAQWSSQQETANTWTYR